MLLDKTNNALPNVLDTNVSNPTTFSSMSGGSKSAYKRIQRKSKKRKTNKRKTNKVNKRK